jgi:dGTPase
MKHYLTLESYACHPDQSRGRYYPEAESETRSPFQRDRDRIIHCGAFRRMKYQTQVFVYHEGDNFRTRLSHSLEVAQIARTISRVLGLNEDLTETLALAHDLGHPPFAHAGEDALKEMTKDVGGFDHNAQALRIVTKLERRYCDFEGLNLTWESLEGLVKHNGPLIGFEGAKPLPLAIASYADKDDLRLDSYASAEAQVAAISDDIAYNNHDIDDGLRAELFTIADLHDLPVIGEVFYDVARAYPDSETMLHIHESVRRIIGMMVGDVIDETNRRIVETKPKTVDDIRSLGRPLVAFSEPMQKVEASLKQFLYVNMYRHYKVNRMSSKAKRVITDLYRLYVDEYECLPQSWRQACVNGSSETIGRVVADYIASMTDRSALAEHRHLFDMQITP